MPAKSLPAKSSGSRIANVFKSIVNDLSNEMAKAKHEFSVDIEIEFKSVTLDEKGIPLFTKSTTQSQLQIKMATRISPPEEK